MMDRINVGLVVFVVGIIQTLVCKVTTTSTTPAMFVFGDSSVDVGNNNYLESKSLMANFSPNGVDFPNHLPTGRFCNGYVLADFLGKKIGLEISPPASMSLLGNHNATQFLKGANFASAGAKILGYSKAYDVPISMKRQIEQFKMTMMTLEKSMGSQSFRDFISKSLFVLSIGNNDLYQWFFGAGRRSKETQKIEFTSRLVCELRRQLKALYDIGARKFAIIGVGNIGCVPKARANSSSGGCNKDFNGLVEVYNARTEEMVEGCHLLWKGMKYSFVRSYVIGSLALHKPQNFGFVETKSGCCGSGKYKGEQGCEPNTSICPDREHYIYWDHHTTQAFNKILANYVWDGPNSITTPVNLKQLLHQPI